MRFFTRCNYRPGASAWEHFSIGWWVHAGAGERVPMTLAGKSDLCTVFMSMSWSQGDPFSDWKYSERD